VRLRKPLILLFLAVSAGCLNEYHPEFHPQSSYTVVQNVSYPQTIIQNVTLAAPSAGVRVRPLPSRPLATESPLGVLDATAERVVHAAPRSPAALPAPEDSADPREAWLRDISDTRSQAIARVIEASPRPITPSPSDTLPLTNLDRLDAEWRGLRVPPREIDVVADAPIALARRIARQGMPVAYVAAADIDAPSTHHAYVTEAWRHTPDDGLAEMVVKLDTIDHGSRPFPPGRLVGVSLMLDDEPVLLVGKVRGPAVESMRDAYLRAGATVDESGSSFQMPAGFRLVRAEGLGSRGAPVTKRPSRLVLARSN
jgi:hypothetical protein